MTQFDRTLFGFRFVDTNVGDTLQEVAARELNDASRWPDLASLNKLVPPFLTDDPDLVSDGVLLSGSPIIIPAPSSVVGAASSQDAVFGVDIRMSPIGDLMTDGFDFVTIAGRDNLKQSLSNRIATQLGDLLRHLDYGNDVRRLIGKVNGPTKGLIAAQSTKAAVLADPRINAVTSATATVTGDVINVSVDCVPVTGGSASLTAKA